jgi:transposase
MKELVDDKGYHSGPVLADLAELGIRTYTSEPRRKGRRDWQGKHEERDAVYANRRRIRGERGKRLMRRRGELVERSFAHNYETGGMRRTHLRGRENILKRLLIHVGGFNLALVMRKLFGIGKPRRVQDGLGGALSADILVVWFAIRWFGRRLAGLVSIGNSFDIEPRFRPAA